MAEVAYVLLRKRIIRPEIAFDLAEGRLFLALEDRHLSVSPALDLTAFL
ncbi:MAG: hypothetical protein AAFQ04_04390 [Pseudomonadota bacterium]